MVEIAFENERIYKFQELMTLTLDRVILHSRASLIDLYPHTIGKINLKITLTFLQSSKSRDTN